MRKPTHAQTHFLANLYAVSDECLIWPYSADQHGYGMVAFNGGRQIRVTIRACNAWHGPRPGPQYDAAHGPCHNPACWNGAHLSWKTHQENLSADRDRDGTMMRGEQAPWAKLTDSDVLAIRARVAVGEPQVMLCREFGLSSAYLSLLINRKRWTHV